VNHIGGRLEEWREGYVRLGLTVEDRHTNPHGVMHGGVITTLMDEALGGVIASVRGMDAMWKAPHATVDMNVSFLSNARAGDEITVEGTVSVTEESASVAKHYAEDEGIDTSAITGPVKKIAIEVSGVEMVRSPG